MKCGSNMVSRLERAPQTPPLCISERRMRVIFGCQNCLDHVSFLPLRPSWWCPPSLPAPTHANQRTVAGGKSFTHGGRLVSQKAPSRGGRRACFGEVSHFPHTYLIYPQKLFPCCHGRGNGIYLVLLDAGHFKNGGAVCCLGRGSLNFLQSRPPRRLSSFLHFSTVVCSFSFYISLLLLSSYVLISLFSQSEQKLLTCFALLCGEKKKD